MKNDSTCATTRRARRSASPLLTFSSQPLIASKAASSKTRISVQVGRESSPRYGTIAPFTSWWQDHTLRTALKNSVLWYYRELALGVGAERMKEYVTKLNYGNRDTSGGIDRFWLNTTLKISADEQVEFLKALYKEELPFSNARSASSRNPHARRDAP